jgi:hypothetical protein
MKWKPQDIISLFVVVVFVLVTVALTMIPLVAGLPVQEYAGSMERFASLYSGIVGTVLGYYFGRTHSEEVDRRRR